MTRPLAALTLLLAQAAAALAQPAARESPPLPDGVELRKDLVYGRGGDRDLKLDLYLPKQGDGPHPAVVFIHGGGWAKGTKRAFARQAAYLAGKGYVGACIEYRLSGEAPFPAAVEDCKAAVRFLRANATRYQIDPDRIAAAGGSAGGHLAALLGVSRPADGLEGTGGHQDQSSRVQAVVAFNGIFDLVDAGRGAHKSVIAFLGGSEEEKPEAYRKASPLRYDLAGAPPFLFLHGTADQTVPISQARRMAEALRAAGATADLDKTEGAGHGFFNRPPHYEPTLKRMETFLDATFPHD